MEESSLRPVAIVVVIDCVCDGDDYDDEDEDEDENDNNVSSIASLFLPTSFPHATSSF